MLRVSWVFFGLLLLTACNPFAHKEGSNQFTLKKDKLSFMRHELAVWHAKKLPYCTQCSFNIYSKKMFPTPMLFKQINNERGDLVFLAASNIRYSFALQTGGQTYPMMIEKVEGKYILKAPSSSTFTLTLNQVQKLNLGSVSYSFSLQKIHAKQSSVDLVFWLSNPL